MQSPTLYTRKFEGSSQNKNLFVILLSVPPERGALFSQWKTGSLPSLEYAQYLQQYIKTITTTKP